jgi:hypothetical protein
MDYITEFFHSVFRDMRTRTANHPERSDAQIAGVGRRRLPPGDVQAARVSLGQIPFPEDAAHDDRIRLFCVTAWMLGIDASPEVSCGRGIGRCDAVIFDGADEREPIAVIEVKSGMASPAAVTQTLRYLTAFGPEVEGIVTAPAFTASARELAKSAGVRLMSGAEVCAFIERAARTYEYRSLADRHATDTRTEGDLRRLLNVGCPLSDVFDAIAEAAA